MVNGHGHDSLPDVGDRMAGVVTGDASAMADLIDPAAALERLADDAAWAEGPVYLPALDAVLYSDVVGDRALRWSSAERCVVARSPNDFGNGNTLDARGRVVHCEHGSRSITRTEQDGRRVVVVDRYQGRRLNSPNDIVVRSDGTIWFTDPPYGIRSDREGHKADQELDGCYVFRFDPVSGSLEIVSDEVTEPNGLAFSPDESVLYVSDTSSASAGGGAHHIVALDVVEGRRLTGARILATISPGLPDGMRVDERGHVWTSAGDGIHVLTPGGEEIARILVPEVTSNCVFGGPDGSRLFITATTSLYAIDVLVGGAGVAAAAARRVA